jgi:fructoselysine 6-kinase
LDRGDGPVHAAAVRVDIVDTCGAGDSFIAALVSAYCCNNVEAAEALRRASEAAALACTYVGGFRQTPRSIPEELLAKYAPAIAAGELR